VVKAKPTHRYPERFETFVVDKLIEHDDILADHGRQLLKINRIITRLDDIEENVASLMRLRVTCDAFMKEIIENRQERIVIGRQLGDHEERLGTLENAVLIRTAH
jgi:hypothetical protein